MQAELASELELRSLADDVPRASRMKRTKINHSSEKKLIIQLIKRGDFVQARDKLDALFQQQGKNPKLFFISGMLYASQCLYHDALEAFEAVLEYDPTHAAACFEIAVTQMLLCRFNKASAFFRRAKLGRYRDYEIRTYLRKIAKIKKEHDVTLSTCVIARNEEKFLPGCLKSVLAISDEIIVTDTGSTDRTVEIAKSFGAKVYHFEWCNDFAAAKNFCNNKATGDWILQLDADEEVFPQDQNKIRELIHQDFCNGAFVAIHNRASTNFGENEPSVHFLIRLYRNREDIFYENAVHEELKVSGDAAPVDIRILHHGYNLDPDYLLTKRKRNAEILYNKLEQNPDDLATNFYISMMHIGNREFKQSADFARKALQLIGPQDTHRNHLKVMMLKNLTLEALEEGRFDDMLKYCGESIATSEAYLDAFYYLGLAYLNKNELDAAEAQFLHFLQRHQEHQKQPIFNMFSIDAGFFVHQSYHFLGKVYRRKKEYGKSLEMYGKALEVNPGFWISLVDIGYIYIELKEWLRAVDFLDQGIQLARKNKSVNRENPYLWLDYTNAIRNLAYVLKKLNVATRKPEGSRFQ